MSMRSSAPTFSPTADHTVSEPAVAGTSGRKSIRRSWPLRRGTARRALWMTDPNQVGRVMVIALCVLLFAIEATKSLTVPDVFPGVLGATIATVIVLPLHLHHFLAALDGRRPRYGTWTLAAVAAVHLYALVVLGETWRLNLWALLVSALIVLGGRAGLAACAVALVAAWFLAPADVLPQDYYVLAVIWRAVTIVVVVWLYVTVGALGQARGERARQAVAVERSRIEAEVNDAIGSTLGRIEAAAMTIDVNETDAASAVLRTISSESRSTLVDARRMVRSFRSPGPDERAEIAELLDHNQNNARHKNGEDRFE